MKKIYVAFILLTISFSLSAQRVICPKTLNKYKTSGLWAADIFGGPKYWTGYSAGAGIQYLFSHKAVNGDTKYHFPNKFIRANVFYAKDKLYDINHTATGLDVMLGFTPFDIGDIVYGSILAGGTFSRDQLDNTTNLTKATRDELNLYKPGFLYGAELNMFIGQSSNISVFTQFTQRTLSSDYWGNYRWYLSVGVRFHFIEMRPLSSPKGR